MPTWTLPANPHVVSDVGHTSDHNLIVTDLGMVATTAPAVTGGLTGATSSSRYVGGFSSNPGAGGNTWITGDWGPDVVNGGFYVCTAGGTPGTWVHVTAATAAAILDWINVTQAPYNADNTGATDASTAVNNAIAAANPGQPVYAPTGIYKLNGPIVIGVSGGQGCTLIGDHGATASGDDEPKQYGTVFKPSASFTNPTYSSYGNAAIMVIQQEPGNTQTWGVRLRDFWVYGGGGVPASLDGIDFFGSIAAMQCERVGVGGMSGAGFNWLSAPSGSGNPGGGGAPDGIHMYSCLAQGNGGNGFSGVYADGVFMDCHAQSNGQSLSTPAHGFYTTGGNNWFIGCRSDLNGGCGYYFDHRGSINGFQDTNKLDHCGTQGNWQHGCAVMNGSTGGTSYSMPTTITGCDFGGDGAQGGQNLVTATGGNYAGIYVQGANIVEISNTHVGVYTKWYSTGCPKYGLMTGGSGTPNSITISGGDLNWSSGQSGQAILDNAGVGANLVIDGTVQQAAGYAPTSFSTIRPVPYLCPPVSYAPGTQTALAVNTTTMAAFSSANVNTGSFTAPPSGSVVVTAEFVLAVSAASCYVAVGLANHGTTTMQGDSIQQEMSSIAQAYPWQLTFLVTGLTAGTSYNFDLMGCCTSTMTATIYAFGQTSTTPTLGAGGRGGPVLMTVQAV